MRKFLSTKSTNNLLAKTITYAICQCFLALFLVHNLCAAEVLLTELDPDQNGLYDDTERKVLLGTLQSIDSGLTGVFDADNDGKVTILEQTQGRHPLPKIINNASILNSSSKIPWGIDIFPEWIVTGFFQEDVPLGRVNQQPARGITLSHATPTSGQPAPEMVPIGEGVVFEENSAQQLSFAGNVENLWSYRWYLMTFRIDANSGDSDETIMLEVNRGSGNYRSTPKIWYNKSTGLNIQYVGQNVSGLDTRLMSTHDLVTDGEQWNVLVCGIRYGQLYAELNGKPLQTTQPQPPRFSGIRLNGTYTSYIGDRNGGNIAWAYDAIVFGQTEPSEAMVDKMTGWAAHRLGFADRLPVGHPYRLQRPVVDAEDFPTRYFHDNEAWDAWGIYGKSKEGEAERRAHQGDTPFQPEGYERVFYDDFRKNRVSMGHTGDGEVWMGPGLNTAVGEGARLATPLRSSEPNTYEHDAKNQKQYLSLIKSGNSWWGSAMYSVNNLGHGYTWTGPKIFRVRCMFPEIPQSELAEALFPAFWSYSPEWIFWRTENRVEVDWFEFHGRSGSYLNGLSSHVHYPHLKSIFPKNPNSYKSYKAYGGYLSESRSDLPEDIFVWDGKYHSWEFVVEEDMTYINATYYDDEGIERWAEVSRCETPSSYLEDLYLIFDYALKRDQATPANDARQDFVLEAVEVLQKTEQINSVPAPFTALPTLHGKVVEGATITCQPNVEGITDIRYFWFADGYPLTWGPSNTYTITTEEAGKSIRCMVKAVGARDMPEAWSKPTSTADVNGDGNVDLLDTISALQVITGKQLPNSNLKSDVNGDQKIGLPEAIEILNNQRGL